MTETPRVFLSYARRDGAEFASHLREKLEAQQIPLWQDRTGMEGGRDWWLQITEALDAVEFMVLVMTPGALASEIVRKEWRYARQQGVCVYPVKGVPDKQIDFASLPRWMQASHWYDLDQEWGKFVTDLQHACVSPRVPFMADDLPDDFVPRPEEFNHLLNHLLDPAKGDPVAITAALRGAGGYGKTTLARAICHDERIQQAFDDGVLWITLGETPGDLTGRLLDLIYVLQGERPVDLGLDAAKTRLREVLADRDVLLVIDDVWNPAHLKPFTDLSERVAYLITTRNEDTLPGGTQTVNVDAMRADEAVALLTFGIDTSAQSPALRKLAKRLGEWALLLKLANGVLRSRIDKGQSLEDALAYVEKALDKRGLMAFDARNPGERNQAVSKTLGMSLSLLTEDENARYHELAIFPEDVDIPVQTVAKLWGATGNLDDFDTEELCSRLFSLSLLLEYDLSDQTIRLHDILRKFLLDSYQPTELSTLHGRFLDSYRIKDWAELSLDEPYLWDWLVYHLESSKSLRHAIVDTLLDLRFIAKKIFIRDAAAVEDDLKIAFDATNGLIVDSDDVPDLERLIRYLWAVVSSDGHLLNRGKTLQETVTILYSRLIPQPETAFSLYQHLTQWGGKPEVAQRWIINALMRLLETIPMPYIVPSQALPDLPHPALRRTISEPGTEVRDCDIAPDNKSMVAALAHSKEDGVTIKQYDLDTGEILLKIQGHYGLINFAKFSPDGKWIASGGQDKILRLWHVASGQEIMNFEGHPQQLEDCTFSPDGRWIISAAGRCLYVWSVDTAEVVWRLEGHEKRVWGCAISPDQRWLASIGEDQTLNIWDARSGEITLSIPTETESRIGCTFSPDSRWIAAPAGNSTIKLWDAETGELVRSFVGHSAVARNCVFWKNGAELVSCGSDSTVRIWDVATGKTKAVLTGHGGRIWNCAVSDDNRTLVSASGDSTLKIWDVREGIYDQEVVHIPHTRGVRAVCFSPDGTWAVTGSADNTLTIWDHANGQPIRELHGHNGFVNGCAVSRDGKYIASASSDYSVRIWDSATGEELQCLRAHRGKAQAVVFSPDGSQVISCGYDETIRIWDWLAGKELKVLRGHERGHVQDCVLSPDGNLIVSAGRDYSVRLWDAHSGDLLKILTGHDQKVWGCDISPDGSRIVSASWDGTLRLWETLSGETISVHAHRTAVRDCAFSPDGSMILSVSNDRTVKIWDVNSQKWMSTLHVDGELLGCAWHPDGEHFIATGRGGVYFLKLVR